MSERICLACPRPIDPSRRADAKVCADGACRTWVQRHPNGPKRPVGPFTYVCQYEGCSKEFTRAKIRGKIPRFCSDPCWERYRHYNLRGEDYWRDRDVEDTRRWSREWAQRNKDWFRAYRIANWEQELERNKEYQKRRRAWKFEVEYEVFTSPEIYERDEWVCGICDNPVDPELAYPDPFSPSLDHIIPLSKRGPHTRANVQLAHLLCNVRKRDRLT